MDWGFMCDVSVDPSSIEEMVVSSVSLPRREWADMEWDEMEWPAVEWFFDEL